VIEAHATFFLSYVHHGFSSKAFFVSRDALDEQPQGGGERRLEQPERASRISNVLWPGCSRAIGENERRVRDQRVYSFTMVVEASNGTLFLAHILTYSVVRAPFANGSLTTGRRDARASVTPRRFPQS
jgi:hypothetical protein